MAKDITRQRSPSSFKFGGRRGSFRLSTKQKLPAQKAGGRYRGRNKGDCTIEAFHEFYRLSFHNRTAGGGAGVSPAVLFEMETHKSPARRWRHESTRFAEKSGEGFVEASSSRVLRDGEGMFRVTVINASGILEMGAHVKYFGSFDRTSA